MTYRRQWRSSSWNQNKQVHVTLAWNTLVGAYDLKFDQIYGNENWTKLKAIIAWIKLTIPYGERDYDEVSKIWTIHEKYFQQMRDVLQNVGPEFIVTCVEKPANMPQVAFTPIETYFNIFKQASGEDISKLTEADFSQARKIYLRTSMKIHPDKGGDPTQAAAFNEAWDILKERHFKQVRIVMSLMED